MLFAGSGGGSAFSEGQLCRSIEGDGKLTRTSFISVSLSMDG
jgi:hypothetical protein